MLRPACPAQRLSADLPCTLKRVKNRASVSAGLSDPKPAGVPI
jgi:hypothetical protein